MSRYEKQVKGDMFAYCCWRKFHFCTNQRTQFLQSAVCFQKERLLVLWICKYYLLSFLKFTVFLRVFTPLNSTRTTCEFYLLLKYIKFLYLLVFLQDLSFSCFCAVLLILMFIFLQVAQSFQIEDFFVHTYVSKQLSVEFCYLKAKPL